MARSKRPSILLAAVLCGAGFAVRGEPGPDAPAAPVVAPPSPEIRAQQLTTRKAQIAADMARLGRDLAHLAGEEYAEVT